MSNLRKKSCRLMVLMVLAQGAGTLEAEASVPWARRS